MTTIVADPPIAEHVPSRRSERAPLVSVADYHALIAAGVLTTDDRAELLQGWILCKMTKNPPHRTTTALVLQFLSSTLPAGYFISPQDPITLIDSEPEPDFCIIRGSVRDYLGRHPGGADVALAIEISDATLAVDRIVKQQIYAGAGIPRYWIINVAQRQVEVYSAPTGPTEQATYRRVETFREQSDLPLILDGALVATVEVRKLLP